MSELRVGNRSERGNRRAELSLDVGWGGHTWSGPKIQRSSVSKHTGAETNGVKTCLYIREIWI